MHIERRKEKRGERGEMREDETERCGFKKEMRDGGGEESWCRGGKKCQR